MILNSTHPYYDVVVVGAGHAGLSISYFLSKLNLRHVVFERGRIGETWKSQRWDSFALNTPNWMSALPGHNYEGENPEGFYSLKDFTAMLNEYAERFALPVIENAKVLSIEKADDSKLFSISVSENGEVKNYLSRQVVIASGIMNEKKIPSITENISPDIAQIHTSEYRNPSQLQEGAVLVVGSGQSGCQITEDLIDGGRKVFLSTSMVGRTPRRYRGKDVMDWFNVAKLMDTATDKVTDPQMLTMKPPQVSGVGALGHTVSLQSLARQGAMILGKVERAEGSSIFFQPNASTHVKFADDFSKKIKDMIDGLIEQNAVETPQNEPDLADEPDISASCASELTSLDLKEKNIHTIIWTTGFSADFSRLKLPVLNSDRNPEHKHGLSDIKGLYFLGFPWLRKRKSGIIFGIGEDAEFIAGQIFEFSNELHNKQRAV